MHARTPLVALLLAALAAAAWAEDANEETLFAAEMAADRAERDRVQRERDTLALVDEDVAAICRVLDNTKIDLDFPDASLEDIIGFIREYARLNIEIDQRVREQGLAEKKIDFRYREIGLREALETLLGLYELDYTLDQKVLLIVLPSSPSIRDMDLSRGWRDLRIAPPEGVDSAKADDEIRRVMKERKISLGFTDCPLDDVLGFLTEYMRIRFCVDAGSVAKAAQSKITFRVDELPFEQAFDLILKITDLSYYVQGGVVHIVSGEMTCVMTACEDWRKAPKRRGPAPLGKNDQGYEEYRDELTEIVLVRIPAGEYRTQGEDGATGWVRVDAPFLIGKTEVTNEQFRRFAEWRRFLRGHHSGVLHGVSLNGDDQPVVNLSWYEVHGFCLWSGLRLPHEKEWELVARGGDGRRFPWGNEWPPPPDAGNYADAADDSSDGLQPVLGRRRDGYLTTARVGKSRSNPFGVYDIGGNVWEWCAGPVDPPPFKGPPHTMDYLFSRSRAVLRGGSWYDLRPSAMACDARLEYPSRLCNSAVGFRVAMDAPR